LSCISKRYTGLTGLTSWNPILSAHLADYFLMDAFKSGRQGGGILTVGNKKRKNKR
tara:strand:+ start:314 stop:481 length:168 start_codon:yes stop_codon:yes gene_type:complete